MKRVLIFMVIMMMLTSMAAFGQQGRGFQNATGGDCRTPHMGKGIHGKGGQGEGLHRILKLSEEIGLDETQIDKIKQMSEGFALERVDRNAELKKARIQMRNLKADGSENEVMNMIDKIADLEADLDKMKYKHQQEIKSILTDEQLDKLESIKKDRGDRGKGLGKGKGNGKRIPGFNRDGN